MWIWLLSVFLPSGSAVAAEFRLSAPQEHIALSGAIEVSFYLPSPVSDIRIQLVRLIGKQVKPVAKRDVPPKLTQGKIVFPCTLFEKAGQYAFKLMTLKEEKILAETHTLYVRWPAVTIHVPLIVETYSSDISIQLYVDGVRCKPRGSYITFVDLIYESESSLTWHKSIVLTSKELMSWMWNVTFELTLECKFFDRAGNYSIHLRTSSPDSPIIAASDTIIVMWSHRYSVSVAKSSVHPCDGSLSVIYHYPRCILDQDKIRVYGKTPRGPMKYIRESRIEAGKHSTKLSCDVFQDDYQEYCFSFVSTARNGAVFDLKTHCLPASVNNNHLSAIWNGWGPWSECSISCGTGVQSRYRLCLSKTNESYCIGKAVQSQMCNTETCSDYISTITEHPTQWDCFCGCKKKITSSVLIHLLVLGCDSEIWWSIQAWPTGHIITEVASFVVPTHYCWLTIRDGKSSLGAILATFRPHAAHQIVHSLTDIIRIEFHCGNISLDEVKIICHFTRSEIPLSSLAMAHHNKNISDSSNLSAVHITIIMLAAVLCTTITLLILIQFFRKNKLKSSPGSTNFDNPDLLTSTSEMSIKTPSINPEDYLYNSFIFRSYTSLQSKFKCDQFSTRIDPSDISSPIRLRSRLMQKNAQRESSTPLAASLSELSLTGSEDGFEYDYYDYGCHQEPGSFFSPDPVLMGWPPFIPLPPQGMEEFGDYPLQQFTPPSDNS